MATCEAITKAGTQCGWRAGPYGDGLCHVHSPSAEAKVKRQEMQTLANASNMERNPKALVTLDDAIKYAAWVAHQFAAGKLDADQVKAADKLLDRFSQLIKARDRDTQIAKLLALKEAK